jgi:ABC-type multidrug transport system fused ATPase/permease subunit|tara:strand:+ start:7202 stop:9271 length:2070 start_codon:yes stop_codon:yes gene_type:complete
MMAEVATGPAERGPYEPDNRTPSLGEQEAALDARASLIDTDTDISFSEALKIIGRTAALLRFFWGRFAVNFVLRYGAQAIPLAVLPWPLKIVIDHVVLAKPIEDATGYPAFVRPLLPALQGATPFEILVWLTVIALVMVILIGAFGTSGADRDTTDAQMDEGHDTATKQENLTHAGFSFASGLWGYCEFKIQSRLTQTVNHLLRSQLFEKIKSLPMTTLDDQRIGDSVYRVMYDTPSVNKIFFEVVFIPALCIMVFTSGLTTMWSAYPDTPEIMYFALAVFPITLVTTMPFGRLMRRRHQASRAAGTVVTSTIEEGMDNVLAVQSLGGNQKEKERFGADSGESFKRYRATVLIDIVVYRLVGGLLERSVYVLVILFITNNVIEGTMSPGDYIALLYYFSWMRGTSMTLARFWVIMQSHVAGMRRVYALMDLPQEVDMGDSILPRINEGVSFRGAGLVYPDGRRALEDVDLDVRIGQIVALVGPTGAGKTSLAYLIPRYHVATEGTVLVDGHDVRDLKMQSLREQVTYVFQETQLFSDSILDNIRYGKPEASQQEVERVARIAGVHDFIASLPEGYHTRLGTTSAKLSVGQKQRISIARGLLRESRILILDEPTSALDPETEQYLVQALHEAAKDRLVIIIAHRLSTIAHADQIVFLEDGRVLEQGTGAELMALEEGHYRNFVELQTAAM